MSQVNNIHHKTVEGFGDEWRRFDQTGLSAEERHDIYTKYFKIFPWDKLPQNAIGFDLGCGSGRWATMVADRVAKLYCLDPSHDALKVAQSNLKTKPNCQAILAGVDDMPFEANSMDFGYSLGVLHHVPDTQAGIVKAVKCLKPGAPLLLYLYYAFDQRPWWFKAIWQVSNFARKFISSAPYLLRYVISQFIAFFVYWPLARSAWFLEKLGRNVENIPLAFYRHLSFYTMRTDALDRFGTRLEHRFTRDEIKIMMENAGLTDIRFSDGSPYWVAVGIKKDK